MRARRAALAVVGVLSLMVGLLSTPASAQAPASWSPSAQARPAPGPGVPVRPYERDVAAGSAWQVAPEVEWPRAKAVASSIRLGKPGQVELLSTGKDLTFRVSKATQPAPMTIDYSAFRYAFGGDYGSRLQLSRMDGSHRKVLPATNNTEAGTLTAVGGNGTYAVTGAPAGGAGSYRATTLAPSATWQVGLGSGDFTWSYPLALPKMPGNTPELAISYNSGSVDGRISSTNNQPSILGEGFDLRTGYVERSYQPCSHDGQAGVEDLCFASNNAVVVLPGLTSELVCCDTDGRWRTEHDEGWRIEQLFGASNGDNDGEHWKLTSPGGVQYFFGRSASTNSAWTVPVYGDDSAEPCHSGSFAASWCQQAYRWALDRVVDAHGDAVSYFYDKETNHYNRAGTVTPYVRSGHITRIEYGNARVLFAMSDRCVPGSSCLKTQPQSWPDVPLDLECDGGSCPVPAPTFWSTKRLTKITTQVSDGGFKDVDSWTFAQTFPSTDETGSQVTSPALWLQSITRAGHAGGSTITLPPVTFAGNRGPNRVDATGDEAPALNKYRVDTINNEYGGSVKVSYAPVDCTPGSLPTPDLNVKRCFPAFWTPSGSAPKLDWFTKYVVTQVLERDHVADALPKKTSYEYVDPGTVLWSHDDSEVVPAAGQSWGQWRGYQKVRVRVGAVGNQTLTEHLFLRGLFDDERADGSKRQLRVDDPAHGLDAPIDDRAAYRGLIRQTTTFDGSTVVNRKISEPAVLGTTATRVRPSGVLESTLVDEQVVRTYTTLESGGARVTETRYGYDSRGRLLRTSDLGDIATTADDLCTRNTYVENATTWIINTRSRVETLDAGCDASGRLVGDVLYTYNDAADVTMVQEWDGTGYVTVSRTVPDALGRPLAVYDAANHKTSTAYTPVTGGPVTARVVTNPMGHVTTANFDPLRGLATSTVDANGQVTNLAHDALGRLTSVWLPGRSTDATPNTRYEYAVRGAGGPSAITTRPLVGPVRHEMFDGLLRPVQTQEQSAFGGRVVTDTVYDSRGLVTRSVGARVEDAPAGTSLVAVPDSPESETRYAYDQAGRVTTEAAYSAGTRLWATTTAYGGDRIHVDPPTGRTATTTIMDGRDRTVELRQYTGPAPTGSYDATTYTYTRLGDPATVTDPLGNVRRYSYDVRRRQIRSEAPDTGVVTVGYDVQGRLTSTTDARNRTLTYSYDALDRRTAIHEGGTKLAEWTYDTAALGIGLKATSTRHAGGAAYTTAVTGYDNRGRRTGVSVMIPPVETGLGGTYTTSYTYTETDQLATATLPAAGGLAQETVTYGYDGLGNPTTLTGATTYVAQTGYDDLGAVMWRAYGQPGRQVYRQFGYDPVTRRLAQVTSGRDHGTEPTLSDVTYTYDPGGNLTSVVDAPDGVVRDAQCFRYDHLRRLTTAWTPGTDCSAGPSMATLGGDAPYWQDFTYDKVGNRLTEVWHAAGNITSSYGYQAAQPHTVRSVAVSGPGVSRTDAYGFDASGNLTASPGRTYTWDAEGRVTTAGGESYVYGADGNRLVRRTSSGTTLYLGHTEVHRSSGGSVTGTRYYDHNGTVVASRTPVGLTWLLDDQQGTSGLAIADQSGLPATRRYHLPFGGRRGASPAGWQGDRGFLGATTDSTGLIHLGAREYDPALGRFLSADPVIDHHDPQQMNGYGYADSNPATFSDPDGLKKTDKLGPEDYVSPYGDDRNFFDDMAYMDIMTFCEYIECGSIEIDGCTIWDCAGSGDDYAYEEDEEDDEDDEPTYYFGPAPCGGWGGQCVEPRPWGTFQYDTYSYDTPLVPQSAASHWRPTPLAARSPQYEPAITRAVSAESAPLGQAGPDLRWQHRPGSSRPPSPCGGIGWAGALADPGDLPGVVR